MLIAVSFVAQCVLGLVVVTHFATIPVPVWIVVLPPEYCALEWFLPCSLVVASSSFSSVGLAWFAIRRRARPAQWFFALLLCVTAGGILAFAFSSVPDGGFPINRVGLAMSVGYFTLAAGASVRGGGNQAAKA